MRNGWPMGLRIAAHFVAVVGVLGMGVGLAAAVTDVYQTWSKGTILAIIFLIVPFEGVFAGILLWLGIRDVWERLQPTEQWFGRLDGKLHTTTHHDSGVGPPGGSTYT